MTKEDNVLSYPQDAAGDQAALETRMSAGSPLEPKGKGLLAHILKSLEDDKAEDVVEINLSGKSDMADFMVIASGRSSRQVVSMSEKLVDRLKQECGLSCKVEGKDSGDWVLIDAGDVIVHVFRPEVREFYQLEKMWLSPATASA